MIALTILYGVQYDCELMLWRRSDIMRTWAPCHSTGEERISLPKREGVVAERSRDIDRVMLGAGSSISASVPSTTGRCRRWISHAFASSHWLAKVWGEARQIAF